jgi:hypothetical protein
MSYKKNMKFRIDDSRGSSAMMTIHQDLRNEQYRLKDERDVVLKKIIDEEDLLMISKLKSEELELVALEKSLSSLRKAKKLKLSTESLVTIAKMLTLIIEEIEGDSLLISSQQKSRAIEASDLYKNIDSLIKHIISVDASSQLDRIVIKCEL